jgi:polar amino acid transport system substrate-binding protein
LDNEQVFVVRKDSGIKTKADLAGKVVTVQADSSAEAAINDLPDLKATFKSLNTIADYNAAFMELESGATDAIAMDSVVANYQIEKRDADFVILDEAIASEEYGVGFYKGNTELRDKVQKALEDMVKDGTMATISTKWFGSDITTIGK